MLVISFDTEEVRLLFEDFALAQSQFSPEVSTDLIKRVSELRAATVVFDLPASCREFIGEGTDERLIINLHDSHKIIICPNMLNVPLLDTGRPNWTKIKRVKVLGINNS